MVEGYFKLVGKKTWYFRISALTNTEDQDYQCLKFYNSNRSVKAHKTEVERIINYLMTDYSLKYEILTEQEVESIKLLYEG